MFIAYAMLLADPRWQELRRRIIRMFKGRCAQCGRRRKDGAVLQAHHLEYIEGRAPWDYSLSNFIALCRDCHYREHHPEVRIPPKQQLPLFSEEEMGPLFHAPIRSSTSR